MSPRRKPWQPWPWLRRWFQMIYSDTCECRRTWTSWSTKGPECRELTPEERQTVERAFAKFDEGFKEIDKLFTKSWR